MTASAQRLPHRLHQPHRRLTWLVVGLVVAAGAAVAVDRAFFEGPTAKNYTDRAGDVVGGSGPDIVSIGVSNTNDSISFRLRFASAPPLRASTDQTWVDMLLIGIDVPPVGPPPMTPGGEWPGANFALGTHGPSNDAQLVRLGNGITRDSRLLASPEIVTRGATVILTVPRRVLGGPSWFTFSVATARETGTTSGGGVDIAPARGTFRYSLT
jgi:hypothetical protein